MSANSTNWSIATATSRGKHFLADDSPWEFEFYVLADPNTVNAFALPGGPVFITTAMIGQLINMQYGRDDKLESDSIGVCLMIEAGYNPEGMIEVMQVLAEASAGNRQPEFFSTHPNPDNRIAKIENMSKPTIPMG